MMADLVAPGSQAGDEAARTAALAQARARVAADAAAQATRARTRSRRGRIMKVLVVALFAVMAFERAVNAGWLHL